ncbi:hypothetical protein NNG48_07335 [Enterococcus faecium]|nr:hypothetical protein [Enterococcus faecium]
MDTKKLLSVLEGIRDGSLWLADNRSDEWLKGFHEGRMSLADYLIKMIKEETEV